MARPNTLTPERHVAIENQVAAGQRQSVAAELSGISGRTVERWVARGMEAEELARERILELDDRYRTAIANLDDEPYPVPDDLTDIDLELVTIDDDGVRAWRPRARALGYADGNATRMVLAFMPYADRPFCRLWRSLTRARAAAEGLLVQRWREAATGIPVEEEITTEKYDASGNVTERTVVTKRRRERDWRAAQALLAVRHRDIYGKQALPRDEDDPERVPTGTLEDEQTRALAAIDELSELRERKASSDG
jgi:hypothetical protein